MELKHILIFIAIIGITSCKDSPTTPIDQNAQPSDSLIVTQTGGAQLNLDHDATATILLIGGGGGGAGGSKHTGANNDMTTGGGGGGGAGEVLKLTNVDLKAGVNYVIFVGKGGSGGFLSSNGVAGGITTFTDNDGMFYSAKAGGSGRASTDDMTAGGQAGTGFPSGTAGENGKSSGVGSSEPPAKGGIGGDNLSGFGKGGNGGSGSRFNNSNVVQADPGQGGNPGYIKVVYTNK